MNHKKYPNQLGFNAPNAILMDASFEKINATEVATILSKKPKNKYLKNDPDLV